MKNKLSIKAGNCFTVVLSFVSSALASLPVAAQSFDSGSSNEGVTLSKNVTESTTRNNYTINLETYVKGYSETTTSYVSKPTDYVLILDYSLSPSATYKSDNGTYQKATRTKFTYNDWNKGNKTYTWDGVNYTIKTVKTTNSNFTTNNIWWAYIEKDGLRYYLTPMGSVVKCDKVPTNADKYLVGENGEIIDPADGNAGVLWSTINYTQQDATKFFYAMQKAATDFIDYVKEDAKMSNVDHRIGIIAFSNDAYPKYSGAMDNDMKNYDNPSYSSFSKLNYSFKEYREELYGNSTPDKKTAALRHMTTVSTNNNVDVLKASLSNMASGGASPVDRGLLLGKAMRDNQGRASNDVAKIAILFTDGVPENVGGKDDTYKKQCANNAVAQAKKLKDEGYTVYTVGLFGTNSDAKSIMEAISSNYPSATTYTSPGTKVATKYCKDASKDNLSDIFIQIAKETTKDYAFEGLTEEKTTIIDVVSSGFKLPDGANSNQIRLSVAQCTNMTTDGSYEFGEPIAVPNDNFPNVKAEVGVLNKNTGDGGTATVFMEQDGGKVVSVTGFDFSANFVGPRIKDGQIVNYDGYKLIISFDIEIDPSNPGGATMNTNTEDSGIYISDEKGNVTEIEQPVGTFEIPSVKIPNIVIIKNGLKKGDSAIFHVYKLDESTNVFSTDYITLVATCMEDGQPAIAKSHIMRPGRYKVEETTWSWTYGITQCQNSYTGFEDSSSITDAEWHEKGYGIDGETGYLAQKPKILGTETTNNSITRNVNDFTEQEDETLGYKGTLFIFTNNPTKNTPTHGEAYDKKVFNKTE